MLIGLATYLVPFAFLILIVVAVHEWGHYYAARIIGVDVSHFALGMGPVLLQRRGARGTLWQIRLLPIGGFVRFRDDEENPEDEDTRRRLFRHRSPGDRAFVIAAGPAVNLILGLLIISALHVTNGKPYLPAIVDVVVAGSPADAAGLQPGDRIVAVNGREISNMADVVSEISMHPNTTMTIGLIRGEETLALPIQSGSRTVESFGVDQTVGLLGIASNREIFFEPMASLEAIGAATEDVATMTRGMFLGLWQIASGTRPVDDVGGPLRMAEMSGGAAALGLESFALFVAVVSINLGVLNLIPLPVLDGGQLLICCVEKIIRRPMSERVLWYFHSAGAAILVVCMIGVTANDLLGILSRDI